MLVWGYLSGEGGKERGVGKAAEKCLQGLARYCVTEEMMVEAVEAKEEAGPETEDGGNAYTKAKGSKKQIHPQQQGTSAALPILSQIIGSLRTSLHALRALGYLPSTLAIVSTLISRLRLRPARGGPTSSFDPRKKTVAQSLMMELVKDVGGLRIQRGFELKEKADDVLGMAVEVVGPEGVLAALPLNVESDR